MNHIEQLIAVETEAVEIIASIYPDQDFVLQLATDYGNSVGHTLPDESVDLTFRLNDADLIGQPDYQERLRARMLKSLQVSVAGGPGAAEVAALLAEAEPADMPAFGTTFSDEEIRAGLTNAEISAIGEIEATANGTERIEGVQRILAQATARLQGAW